MVVTTGVTYNKAEGMYRATYKGEYLGGFKVPKDVSVLLRHYSCTMASDRPFIPPPCPVSFVLLCSGWPCL